jgi:hypothetical protein
VALISPTVSSMWMKLSNVVAIPARRTPKPSHWQFC